MTFSYLLILIGSLLRFSASGESIEVIATEPPQGARLTLHRISPEDQQLGPELFATVKKKGENLILTPAFVLSPGDHYVARLCVEEKVVESRQYIVPLVESPPPSVVRILPTAKVVPANLLKFYIEFNQPMREGREIFDRIHLRDLQTNQLVHDPWRRRELWFDDSKRLTLWIHPGRIKQGVNLREQFGPVLLPGRKYELILDRTIQNPNGRQLAAPVRFAFQTSDELRKRVSLDQWKIVVPEEKPLRKLTVHTDRPLDPFLVRRYLKVHSLPGDREIPCQIDWSQSHTQFALTGNWIPGKYRLTALDFLEDLAGNTPERVFDRDLSVPESDKPTRSMDFEIR